MSTSTTRLGLTKPAAGENYSRSVMNNNSDLIDAYASGTADKMAKGLVYEKNVSTATGSLVDGIAENIASFTFKANRNYRIVWDFTYYMTGNSDSLFYCTINSASTADAAGLITGLTVLQGRTKFVQIFVGASSGHTGPIVANYNPGASDVTIQIKFRCTRVYGDDGIIVAANANEYSEYLIYDEGQNV